MKGSNEIISKIDRRKLFVFCLSFSVIFFGLGFRIIYQPDIYERVAVKGSELATTIFTDGDGRTLNMVLMSLLHMESFSFLYYTSLISSIIIISFTTYKYGVFLVCQLEEHSRTNSITTYQLGFISAISCITIANICSAAFFLYIDMTVSFVAAIFLSVEASILFIQSLPKISLKQTSLIFTCLLMVAFLYETISSLFIVITVPFILYYSKSFIELIKKQIMARLLYAVPLIVKTIYTRVVIKSERANFTQPTFSDAVQLYVPKIVMLSHLYWKGLLLECGAMQLCALEWLV